MGTETTAFGPFVLDRRRQVLTRNGEPVPIGHRGYTLLETLLDADGEPVDKARLMERAWPGTIVEEGNLSVQIAALRKQLGGNAEALIVTVPRVGYRFVKPASLTTRNDTGRPLIAVLPFANLSSESEQGYFADGVVDDIITALSRFKTFTVVARNSSFAYKGRAVNISQAARELGVRYVLEGSVRRSDKQVRVTTQLIEASSGAHLWAEKFDGNFEDIFDFQDRITERVVGLIEPHIRKTEIERARRKRPESLDAYDLFLRALPSVYGMDPNGFVTALDLLVRAIALDPGFAPALAYAAWIYEKRMTLGLPPLGTDDRQRCLNLARAALAVGGDDPVVTVVSGWVLIRIGGDYATGLAAARRALAANPNNLVVLNLAGISNVIAGNLDEASACYQRAFRLCPPEALDVYENLAGVGFAYFYQRNFEAAIECCLRSLATFNEWPTTYVILAAAYAHLDRMDEARAAMEKLLVLAPQATLADMQRLATRDDTRWEILISGLRKAGLRRGELLLE